MSAGNRNVDDAEVSRFDLMAARWWDPRGECRPLHELNPVRLGFVRRHVELEGTRIADVGCGGGILAESLALAGARVVGIDAAEAPLQVAKLHQMESGAEVDYRRGTAEELADAEPGAFHAVTCMELAEHVPDPDSLMGACARLVKPGGHVFVSTLNRTLRAYALAVLGAEYVLGLLPRGTHDYRRFIRPAELAASARSSGLRVIDIAGLGYNPLTGTAALVDEVSVNYVAAFRRDD